MNIKNFRKPSRKIKEISEGNCFEFEKKLFLKIFTPELTGGISYNAVNLTDSKLHRFDVEIIVIPIQAEVVCL